LPVEQEYQEVQVRMSMPHVAATWRFFPLVMMALLLITGYFFTPPPAKAATAGWKTFHDPLYGFSLSYPDTWILAPERDGSHITLLNPVTQTAMSPIVTTQAGTPAGVLKQATPSARAIGVRTRTVAGHPAIDYTTPYVPAPVFHNQDADTPGPLQNHAVILPVSNTSGTTNVYTFLLTQPTDPAGKISAAEQEDNTTFETMLNSFTLPATVASVTPYSYYPCDAVCWSDNNWNYTYYDDSSGSYSIYCDLAGYNNSYSTNPQCVDGNQYGAQVPSNGVGGGSPGTTEYFQPNFQCADFVSRALTQNYQIAGVGNGGVKGVFPATPPIGAYSYQTYRFTYTPYSSDKTYNLIYVPNFKQYLLDSGLGISIGTNIAEAQPGDVVIYYNSSGTAIHTMIITSTVQDGWTKYGGWDAIMNGHNASAYHNTLQWWMENPDNASFSIIHMRGSLTGSSGQATRYGSGWTNFTDGYGQSASWVYTISSGNATAWAQFSDYEETTPCAVAVYVPSGNALANLTFGVEMANNGWVYRTVNEANIDGWALLYKWGELSSPPELINVGNNNGQSNVKMGIGEMAFLC
jgi:hypothetical protein